MDPNKCIYLVLRISRVTERMVTSSSAAVGWMPMQSSNCAFVAPIFTATATPCRISAASPPTMCTPTTLSVATSTIIFMNIFPSLPEMVFFMGRKDDVYTSMSPHCSFASSSVSPTVPICGCVNTAQATLVWSGAVWTPPKSVFESAMPSISATGVRLMRSVTSPMAQMLSTVVCENLSTLMAPLACISTPTASRPRCFTFGLRPVANITCSASITPPLCTSWSPSAVFSTAVGVVPGCMWMPFCFSCSAKNSRTSVSKPRKGRSCR
mmetsp:Transcript_33708/g.56615  ORF Transcript_33708/g.56615 Transcript_33708/m.56615 type:complete len:267 (+) Transcript_33708:466-1266(+)